MKKIRCTSCGEKKRVRKKEDVEEDSAEEKGGEKERAEEHKVWRKM